MKTKYKIVLDPNTFDRILVETSFDENRLPAYAKRRMDKSELREMTELDFRTKLRESGYTGNIVTDFIRQEQIAFRSLPKNT